MKKKTVIMSSILVIIGILAVSLLGYGYIQLASANEQLKSEQERLAVGKENLQEQREELQKQQDEHEQNVEEFETAQANAEQEKQETSNIQQETPTEGSNAVPVSESIQNNNTATSEPQLSEQERLNKLFEHDKQVVEEQLSEIDEEIRSLEMQLERYPEGSEQRQNMISEIIGLLDKQIKISEDFRTLVENGEYIYQN